MFDAMYPFSYIMGSIGSIIGHEITHSLRKNFKLTFLQNFKIKAKKD